MKILTNKKYEELINIKKNFDALIEKQKQESHADRILHMESVRNNLREIYDKHEKALKEKDKEIDDLIQTIARLKIQIKRLVK